MSVALRGRLVVPVHFSIDQQVLVGFWPNQAQKGNSLIKDIFFPLRDSFLISGQLYIPSGISMTFKNIYPLPSHELREILASPRNTKRLKEGYYLFMFVSPTRILFAHVQFNVSRSIWVLQPMCIDYTFGHEIL